MIMYLRSLGQLQEGSEKLAMKYTMKLIQNILKEKPRFVNLTKKIFHVFLMMMVQIVCLQTFIMKKMPSK